MFAIVHYIDMKIIFNENKIVAYLNILFQKPWRKFNQKCSSTETLNLPKYSLWCFSLFKSDYRVVLYSQTFIFTLFVRLYKCWDFIIRILQLIVCLNHFEIGEMCNRIASKWNLVVANKDFIFEEDFISNEFRMFVVI